MIAAPGETAMPTGHMLQTVTKAITVANERILITDGTAEEFIFLTKLCRRPLVIAASADVYDAGLVEIAEALSPPAPAPQCLVSPETLPTKAEVTGESCQTVSEPSSTTVTTTPDAATMPVATSVTTTATNKEVA
jgi:hypothetical protein